MFRKVVHRLHDRIGLLLTHAVAALDPADRAERIARSLHMAVEGAKPQTAPTFV